MRTDYIEVHIARPDGQAVQEHENRFLKKHAAFGGSVFSKLIDVNPTSDISVNIKFTEKFELWGAAGVAIKIRCDGHKGQIFWIDKTDLGVTVSLDHIKYFYPTCIKRWQLEIPEKSTIKNALCATTAWNNDIDTNSGCITVMVCRGMFSNRTGFMSKRRELEPSLEQYQNMVSPKTIREDWFTPIEGEHGQTLAFQFKNMDTKDITQPCTTSSLDLQAMSARVNCRSKGKFKPQKPSRRSKVMSGKPSRLGGFFEHSRYAPAVKPRGLAKLTCQADDDDEDDEDDEEVLPENASDGAAVKQEEGDPTSCAAPKDKDRERPTPQKAGPGQNAPERQESTAESSTNTLSTKGQDTGLHPATNAGADADDELLRLRLEENLIRQQLRRNELRRTGRE